MKTFFSFFFKARREVAAPAEPGRDTPTCTSGAPYEARREEFLLRLSALSRELGITVDGCGCCGSPFVRPSGPLDLEGPPVHPVVFDEAAREYRWRGREGHGA